MKSCAKWEKRLQRLEKRMKTPRIKFIISFVDSSRKVVRRATFGPNGQLIDLPDEEDEDPKEIPPVPTKFAQKALRQIPPVPTKSVPRAPGEIPNRGERILDALSDKPHEEQKEIPQVPASPVQKALPGIFMRGQRILCC